MTVVTPYNNHMCILKKRKDICRPYDRSEKKKQTFTFICNRYNKLFFIGKYESYIEFVLKKYEINRNLIAINLSMTNIFFVSNVFRLQDHNFILKFYSEHGLNILFRNLFLSAVKFEYDS
jgi:hypothetical protein